jgi:hypothetical protein
VDFEDSAINHGVFDVRIIRDCIEDPIKNIKLGPENIMFDPERPFEHCVPIAELAWQITP